MSDVNVSNGWLTLWKSHFLSNGSQYVEKRLILIKQYVKISQLVFYCWLVVMVLWWNTGMKKLKPLVTGKSNKARYFKFIEVSQLPIIWISNQKDWITSRLIQDWIDDINKQMHSKKILTFLDNATSHVADISLSNVILKFLPANTMSAIQPIDQGIIQAFKFRHRKHLMIHPLY